MTTTGSPPPTTANYEELCKSCGTAMEVKVSHSEKNPNRPFFSCPNTQEPNCKKSFAWVTTNLEGFIVGAVKPNYQQQKQRAGNFVTVENRTAKTKKLEAKANTLRNNFRTAKQELQQQKSSSSSSSIEDQINSLSETLYDTQQLINNLEDRVKRVEQELVTGYRDHIQVVSEQVGQKRKRKIEEEEEDDVVPEEYSNGDGSV
jgi:hypothetical protein